MSKLSDDVVARLTRGLVVPALPDRYEALEVIGRGGMGVVWRARDRLLDRDVAIKVLAEHANGDELAVRLRREARILARLEHPGIVAVHDAGALPDGRAWYAMRLVRGERLDAAAAGFASIGDAIRVVMRIAETVAFAHAGGVVHRDLTPRNVMLGPFGEVLILDWGVARDAAAREMVSETAGTGSGPASETAAAGSTSSGAAAGVTHASTARAPSAGTAHGTILGTPGYMAPEQAAGLPADERSDVYGLGAILHSLQEASGRQVPKPLAAIRDKARARQPSDRYPDVRFLRDDLARFQDGRPVSAYKEGLLDKTQRVWRQHKAPILLVVAYLTLRLAILWWRGV